MTRLLITLAVSKGIAALYEKERSRLSCSPEEFCSLWHNASEQTMAEFAQGLLSFEEQRLKRVRTVFGATLSDSEARPIFEYFLKHYERSFSLFNDVLSTLAHLSRTHELGIISNGNGKQQRLKLSSTKIDHYFKVQIFSGELGFAKPHPEIFREALRLSSERPVFFVGDREELDALAAQQNGIIGVWLDRRGDLPYARVPRISSLLEFPGLIESFRES